MTNFNTMGKAINNIFTSNILNIYIFIVNFNKINNTYLVTTLSDFIIIYKIFY